MHQISDHGHNTRENMMTLYHTHSLLPNQCSSSLVQNIDAPLSLVWSMVRQFDKPQVYKIFVKKCECNTSDIGIGSVREVTIISGLPACTSMERLDRLDNDRYIMMFSMIGGDHRLLNYTSTITLHWNERESGGKTVVMESYVVNIPVGSSKEDTCLFADTIIGCNLKSLARLSEKMASNTN